MLESNILFLLKSFFQSNGFRVFYLDLDTSVIKIDSVCSDDKTKHTMLFEELTKITTKLEELSIDYSLDVDGTILLN